MTSKALVLLISFLVSLHLLSQDTKNYACPLRKGKILPEPESWKDWGTRIPQVEITSKNPDVYSMASGVVIAIDSSVGNSLSIGVERSDTVFIYDNLAVATCRIGQIVEKGETIGSIKKGNTLLIRGMDKSEYFNIRKIINCRERKRTRK